jgi:glycosyltransferase involved in cell wall biosynthesis
MSRPRVLQVITRWVLGGARRVVEALLERLPGLGFDVELLCGPDGPPPAAARVLPGLAREIRPARDLETLARLARLLADRRPDVVHAHTYKAGVLACLAGRAAGVRAVVFTPHGHIFAPGASIPGVPAGARLELLRQVTRLAQACAHRVTALSEIDLRQQLELRLAPASKYAVVRNGIDVDRFAVRSPRRFGDGPVLGAVGRFEAEKGHAVLLEALPLVRRVRPDARLVLVGAGGREAALRERAGRADLDGAVVFAGERDAAELLGSFDVFVQPSLYESQGMALLEAMAAGVPVVASEVGGVPDAVRPGETGLLVRPSDPAALAAAVLRLLERPGEAAAIAERARARVRSDFSSARMAADYARLYRDLLGRYNPAPCTTT